MHGDVCHECWRKIYWISRHSSCEICGAPMQYKLHKICDQCMLDPPIYDKAISVYKYDDFSKRPILSLKNHDATYLSKVFAKWIYRLAKDEICSSDIIIPVPIHVKKLQKRMYNQSYLIARDLQKLSKVPVNAFVLEKSKNTLPQEGLTREMRLKNVVESFSINDKIKQIVNGNSVILVDDVITTGATANECSRILKENGAKSVILLTIAKTLLAK